jgi:hypothetical protein
LTFLGKGKEREWKGFYIKNINFLRVLKKIAVPLILNSAKKEKPNFLE